MRAYETTFILAPTLDDDAVGQEVDAVKKIITSEGGEVTVDKEWGRRKLAFPIEDHSEGVYRILRFTLNGSSLPALDRHFKLNENVLRALVIRDEGTPLDVIDQPSEPDDRDHYSRDRGPRFGRPDRSSSGPPPSSERRPAEKPSEASKESPAPAEGEEVS